MGIRDTLIKAGLEAAKGVGQTLIDVADGNPFWKADPTSDEGNETAPGGAMQDTAQNAPAPTMPADDDPRSLFWDPFTVVEQLGYKERPSSVTYGTLRAMLWRMPIMQAIVKLRTDQVASFATPQQDRYQLGFRIKLRDSEQEPTPEDKKFIEQMQTMIMRTGITDNPRGRDTFEDFLKKYTHDSLLYDQGCFEIVQNRKQQPAEFYAVDSSTIRIADTARVYMNEDLSDAVRYVQIYDNMVVTEYTQEQLCFGVRNKRSDLRLYGYGTSEMEMLISTVTSMLYAWEYNKKFFSQGSTAKGLLNFKGSINDKQLRAFRRHWYNMVSGIENAWRSPVTNAEEVQWVSMQESNKDMEFSQWMDFLIKVSCAVYNTDPIELNFKYGNTGQKAAMGESNNREKILESRERGLRPLLRHIATQLNHNIIWPINESFEFAFVGLDAMTRDELATLNQKRVKTVRTVNELRAEEDLEPIEGGDVILDPVYAQLKQGAAGQPGAEGLDGAAPPEQPGPEDVTDDEVDGDSDIDFDALLADLEDDDDEDDDEPMERSMVRIEL